ncbi:TIGR01906 family membrane protein [Sporolactobacillus sp. CPB3-1]|uniref:TIGR01906 family membrane protein n=1 Tax=Sporolactobacillus mangiferae TaxID=2940498 RepID=A0ABT0M837_9BACL|nr:TIGR01906 family membrane protein [Sporolactobacillus mangiferae]MCL1630535.1 TIGR01906 family membrane protein [Sporolactobacillus mangiferae]
MFFSAYRLVQSFLALSIAVFVICLAIIITLSFTPLYYFDIWHLQIANESGFSHEQIVENYNYVIAYLLNPFPQPFELPSLAYSNGGRIHFQEVKRIFTAVEVLLGLAALSSAFGIWKMTRIRDFFPLKRAAVFLTLFTIIPLLLFAMDFNGTFILFHRIFFRNNYWIFDPAADPIIRILPETFFLHAALLILGIIGFGIITMIFTYRKCVAK